MSSKVKAIVWPTIGRSVSAVDAADESAACDGSRDAADDAEGAAVGEAETGDLDRSTEVDPQALVTTAATTVAIATTLVIGAPIRTTHE
jgi:hypothetical protein